MTGVCSNFQVILLAAGLSRRMGKPNKLLLPFPDKPLVRHVAEQIIRSEIGHLNVVTGCDAKLVESALEGLDLTICYNPDFSKGQMSSVRAGYNKISAPHANIMIALADMPKLTRAEYRKIASSFHEQREQKIIIPYFQGKRGNPIVIPAKFNTEIANGSLNAGCRRLVDSRPDDVFKLAVTSSSHIRDIDTPDDYSAGYLNNFAFAKCCF